MPRYFLEVAYKGTNYSGFQIQDNANSVQAEMEKALAIVFRQKVSLTGSSRTDTGVHALQNYFHFDFQDVIDPRQLYNINALLPRDIVLKSIFPVGEEAHCRFDAVSREYRYYIYRKKNPFLDDRAYFFPYKLDKMQLDAAAATVLRHTDFTSFAKRNTQVKTFVCAIRESRWFVENDCLVYRVVANRFLRGMVRGLVGTMLQAGRGKLTLTQFEAILHGRDNRHADFSVPGHGLFLFRVSFTDSITPASA
jgi:tRNA pseudouridine38-40 synthase